MRLSVHRTSWPMTAPFVITGHVFDSLEAVVVTLEREGVCGSGEGVPVYYLQESAVEMLDQIEAVRAEIEAGITREGLLDLMPAGGARNAVDCALWDLEAKSTGQSVWDMADIRLSVHMGLCPRLPPGLGRRPPIQQRRGARVECGPSWGRTIGGGGRSRSPIVGDTAPTSMCLNSMPKRSACPGC